eukprot:m.58577 g.58577  ORF g.58577 m.58577 type:complete len:407 (-) comp19026_c0_seq2:20-1240(-)
MLFLFLTIACPCAAFSTFPVPMPAWPATYKMNQSTLIMACNESSFFNAELAATYGVADFDWSNAKSVWSQQRPMDCQERLIAQAKMVKEINPSTRVMVYRNLVKALPWYTSIREKITDPNYSGWFLHFNTSHPHVPTDNTTLYHDHEQTPDPAMCHGPCDCGVPCGEYLWDHRNASLRDWIINEYILGDAGMGSPYVDGMYIDDSWSSAGPTEEDSHAVEDCGLTPEDVEAITNGWQQTTVEAQAAILKAGGFPYQYFNCKNASEGGCHGNPESAPGRDQTDPKANCAGWLRDNCADNGATIRNMSMFFAFTRVSHHQPFPLPAFEQDLASFLLVRGPYAWLGFGWQGCSWSVDQYTQRPEMRVDYGEPVGVCEETAPNSGIFKREWTKATVEMDCNKWAGSIGKK